MTLRLASRQCSALVADPEAVANGSSVNNWNPEYFDGRTAI